MQKRTKIIVTTATSLALMVVLGGIPFVFLVPLLYIVCSRSFLESVVSGLLYGLVSLMYAFIGSISLVAIAFQQMPLIAILPRILAAALASLSFKGVNALIKKPGRLKRILPINIAASVGSIMNTVLVVGACALFLPNLSFGDISMAIAIPTMLISGVIELVVVNLLVPTLTLTVNKALRISQFEPKGVKS